MTREATQLKNHKNNLWIYSTATKASLDYDRYCIVRNQLGKLTRHLCKEYERNLIENIDVRPKSFRRYVNSRLKTRSTIDDLLSSDGHSVHTDIKKAELFNQLFHQFFTEEDLSHILELVITPVPCLIPLQFLLN